MKNKCEMVDIRYYLIALLFMVASCRSVYKYADEMGEYTLYRYQDTLVLDVYTNSMRFGNYFVIESSRSDACALRDYFNDQNPEYDAFYALNEDTTFKGGVLGLEIESCASESKKLMITVNEDTVQSDASGLYDFFAFSGYKEGIISLYDSERDYLIRKDSIKPHFSSFAYVHKIDFCYLDFGSMISVHSVQCQQIDPIPIFTVLGKEVRFTKQKKCTKSRFFEEAFYPESREYRKIKEHYLIRSPGLPLR